MGIETANENVQCCCKTAPSRIKIQEHKGNNISSGWCSRLVSVACLLYIVCSTYEMYQIRQEINYLKLKAEILTRVCAHLRCISLHLGIFFVWEHFCYNITITGKTWTSNMIKFKRFGCCYRS